MKDATIYGIKIELNKRMDRLGKSLLAKKSELLIERFKVGAIVSIIRRIPILKQIFEYFYIKEYKAYQKEMIKMYQETSQANKSLKAKK